MSLLIAFAEEKEKPQAYVVARLRGLGLQVLQDATQPHHIQATCTNPSLLHREADRLNMLKYNTKGFLQEFEVGMKSNFKPCDKKTGDLFTVSQRNFLLLSVIEQLTTDEEFISEVQAGAGAGEEETAAEVEEGEELLETCLALGVVLACFPPQPADPSEHQQLFSRAVYSWPCNPEGECRAVKSSKEQ
jgi:hypothetical protein